MATLTPTLSLSSASGQVSSDALSFSVTTDLTVVSPIVNISKITATTTGGDNIIVPSVDSPRYVYIKHLGLNAAGSSSGTDKVVVETTSNVQIMELKINEFAFFPFYKGSADLLQLQTSANTVQVEYAFFTRG
tara:strand:- start:826 stop:1224 length:399 start_codon:yes stop_codon:yes gene_type:complete